MSIDTERKFFDFQATATDLVAAGAVIHLTSIAEGADPNQRIGRSVRCKSLVLRTHTQLPDNLDVLTQSVRYMILIDKQPNGALATNTDILQSTVSPFNILSVLQPANFKRFRVLRDFTVVMNRDSRNLVVTKHFIRLNLQPRWGSAGSSIGDIATGALLLFIVTDNAVMTNSPQSSILTRLRWVG